MAAVDLDRIRKVFPGGIIAVDSASIHVPDGEFLVLVGPSGCGKSTLLRIVAGLEFATEGSVSIGGRMVDDLSPKERDVAMVFQNYALYPHMTVRANMTFGLRMRKLPKDEIERRLDLAAGILGLEALLDRKPKHLSGGQRQRVALGRAIVRNPAVFLFDEPLSNLDAKLRVQMRAEISKLHRRLMSTMIYVTHDQVEALTMGDRIVVLNEGVIQQIDTPLALYQRPANTFVAGFIGSPAMNLIVGSTAGSSGLSRFRSSTGGMHVTLPSSEPELEQTELTIGIRPEHIRLVDGDHPNSIQARLEVIEPLGNEIIVHIDCEGDPLIARLPVGPLPEPGSEVRLKIRPEDVHLFDTGSGARIR